ncbi:centromere protein F-like isoform X2 [Emys orbicularis]|uniref:centromere protein F-like isoform X2 n=1 Tax=Emys orbicularis TaxID=82168 RepID=UPI0031FD72BC
MIKTEMMEENMKRLLKWQSEVEINRRSLEEKRKEREKEVLRQLRALETVAQQAKEIILNQDLQQAKHEYRGLRAEFDNAIAQKHHLENNSNELTQKMCRAARALLASQSKENELRRNFEEMKKEKNHLCRQSDEKSEKIHQLEEALKITQHLLKETQKNSEEMKKLSFRVQELEHLLQDQEKEKKFHMNKLQEIQLQLEKTKLECTEKRFCFAQN